MIHIAKRAKIRILDFGPSFLRLPMITIDKRKKSHIIVVGAIVAHATKK